MSEDKQPRTFAQQICFTGSFYVTGLLCYQIITVVVKISCIFLYSFYQQKLDNSPTDDKYFFMLKRKAEMRYAIKSVETGEYLHTDSNGRAFLKAVQNNMRLDKYALFTIMMHLKMDN